MSSFSYEIPNNYECRLNQLLQQRYVDSTLAEAMARCGKEFEDVGLAYYAGLRGDNWDKHAVDVTIEGTPSDVKLLESNDRIVREALEKALKPSSSGLLIREIDYLSSNAASLLPQSNETRLNADIETANLVLSDILAATGKLCVRHMYAGATEDDINDFFRDALSFMGYLEVKDQTRHGISACGEAAGEVDILVSRDGSEVALLEGLKLSSVNTAYIDAHISKAITNYNALGTATFLLAYVTSSDFGAFWSRFYRHLQSADFGLTQKSLLREETKPNAAVRMASTIISRDGFDFPVYFLAIKIGE